MVWVVVNFDDDDVDDDDVVVVRWGLVEYVDGAGMVPLAAVVVVKGR